MTVFATAITSVSNPSEPLTIRTVADFEAGNERWREIAFREFEPRSIARYADSIGARLFSPG